MSILAFFPILSLCLLFLVGLSSGILLGWLICILWMRRHPLTLTTLTTSTGVAETVYSVPSLWPKPSQLVVRYWRRWWLKVTFWGMTGVIVLLFCELCYLLFVAFFP